MHIRSRLREAVFARLRADAAVLALVDCECIYNNRDAPLDDDKLPSLSVFCFSSSGRLNDQTSLRYVTTVDITIQGIVAWDGDSGGMASDLDAIMDAAESAIMEEPGWFYENSIREVSQINTTIVVDADFDPPFASAHLDISFLVSLRYDPRITDEFTHARIDVNVTSASPETSAGVDRTGDPNNPPPQTGPDDRLEGQVSFDPQTGQPKT